jgi:hypothetical protein
MPYICPIHNVRLVPGKSDAFSKHQFNHERQGWLRVWTCPKCDYFEHSLVPLNAIFILLRKPPDEREDTG